MGTLGHAAEEFTENPIEVLAAVVTILAVVVSAVLKAGQRFWIRVWAAIRSKPFVPTETLRIVQNMRASFWAGGAMTGAGTPAMQVCFDGHVTEIPGRDVEVQRAEISKPLTHSVMVFINNKHDEQRPQFLGAHETAEIRAVFFVQPTVAVNGKPWTATLIFIDQYGNRHKVKNCVFRETPTPQGSGVQSK